MNQDKEENPNRRRLLIVLGAVGAIGAIAAIATAASLALFYDPTSPAFATFATGTVTLKSASSQSCTSTDNYGNLAPGYSTVGDVPSGQLGGPDVVVGKACTLSFEYTGSLDAYLGLDVSVTSSAGAHAVDCNGGNASGTQPCTPLYNPSVSSTTAGAAETNMDDGIQVNVIGNGPNGGALQEFGIGNDQTVVEDGQTAGLDTGYNETGSDCSSNRDDCPFAGGSNYTETYNVYVYWPLDTASTTGTDQNRYQGSSATIELTEHSVQAADNPLKSCGHVADTQTAFSSNSQYFDANQPISGWGAGFNAGDLNPAVDGCPALDSNTSGTDWSATTPYPGLQTFYHASN